MKKETCKYIFYKKGNANISTSLGNYAVVCEVFQNKEGRIHIRTVFSGLQPSENSVHEIKFEDGVTIRLGERQSITPSCDFANKPIAVWDIHLSAFTVIYNKNPSSTRSYTLVNFVHEMFTSYEFKIGETLVSLIAQEDYLERVEKIKSREETYLSTATLNFSDCSPEALEKSETICHLISIAQGNIVNWCHYNEYDASGMLTISHHEERIIGRYSANPLFTHQDVFSFIRDTILGFIEFQNDWSARRHVNMYLGAGDQNIFLEVRGMIAVTLIEALKDNLEEIAPLSDEQKAHLERLYNFAKKAIKNGVSSKEDRKIIYENLANLKRPSFSDHIQRLANYADIIITPEDICDFVESRNVLLHTSRYKTDQNGNETYSKEYFRLLGFVDRLFLRLIGYRGKYRDRTKPDKRAMIEAEPIKRG